MISGYLATETDKGVILGGTVLAVHVFNTSTDKEMNLIRVREREKMKREGLSYLHKESNHVSEIQSLNLDILSPAIATLVVAASSAIVPPPPARTARLHQCTIFDLCYTSRLQVPSFLTSLPFSTIDETILKVFEINKIETHLVRLHFSPFNSQNFDLSSSNFSVSVHGSVILRTFLAEFTIVKEFILLVDEIHFDITFDPLGKIGFAFVNTVEVFSAPIDLIVDGGA
ncbi:hypothetical protein L1887_35177 [Cichorium endivia]|nr:hypothetical protein L1887_35177 [Cichorium endivia]